jgi:hypothetical protein
MFILLHVLFGAFIGKEVNSVLILLVLALICHFVMDMIPHWDGFFDKNKFESTREIDIIRKDIAVRAFDVVLAAAICIYLYFKMDSSLVILGALFSAAPDLIKVFYFTKARKIKTFDSYLRFHSKIQKGTKRVRTGLLIQAVCIIILIILIIK